MLSQLTRTPEYHAWQWTLAQKVREGIEGVYAEGADELASVRRIVEAIQGTPCVTAPSAPGTRLDVEAAYLHGPRSQVKFSVGGRPRQCELADLLLLASYVKDGSLQWQRVCFIQAKRGSTPTARSPTRFAIDPDQLTLLRAFPAFSGVSGILRSVVDCRLRNQSGMLGAYALLTEPGDFAVASARTMGQVLGGRRSLVAKELMPLIVSEASALRGHTLSFAAPWWPWDPEHCPECQMLFERCFPFPWHRFWHHHRHRHPAPLPYPFSGRPESMDSVLSCLGLDEFINAWSSLRLGELWHAGARVTSDRNLRDAIVTLVNQVARATRGLRHLRLLLERSSGDEPPGGHRVVDFEGGEPSEGGLAVLSLVATGGQAEG